MHLCPMNETIGIQPAAGALLLIAGELMANAPAIKNLQGGRGGVGARAGAGLRQERGPPRPLMTSWLLSVPMACGW